LSESKIWADKDEDEKRQEKFSHKIFCVKCL
jgi:hypothetical protein